MRRWRGARVLLAAALLAGVAAGPLLTVVPAAAAPSSPAPAPAPEQRTTALVQPPTLLLVDTSGSMGDQDGHGTVKLEGAKTALLELLQHLPTSTRIGLRTYPAGGASCGTGHLDIPIAQRDPATMSASIRALKAGGDTPTAEALRQAGKDLKAAGYTSATIILVADGQSTCDKPCPVARELAAEGLSVTVRAMGFQIEQAGADELRCLAEATGGTYTDVADAASLGTQLAALAGPSLTLSTDVPGSFDPTTQSALDVTATIEDTASVGAADVRASLVFDPTQAGGALVDRPLAVLGDAAAGGKLRVSWTVHPSRTAPSGDLGWTVSVTSRGSPPVTATGQIAVGDRLGLEDAGPLFRDATHVVVLGDSYSSGEGAHDYVTGDPDFADTCHRSPSTYALQLWPAEDVADLACSGAVAADFTGHQADRVTPKGLPEPSQQDQLARLGHPPDLVLLTTGGNDVNVADIIENCALDLDCSGPHGPVGCAAAAGSGTPGATSLACTHAAGLGGIEANPAFWSAQLGGLHTTLVRYYQQVLAHTGTAPVVVLPYVDVVPDPARGLPGTGCTGGLPGVGRHELDLIRWLQAELDDTIASSVRDVQATGPDGARLYYAADVATALEPDHTLCADEDQRWVVGIATWRFGGYEQQEVVHPTAAGYKAIAGALVRWSTTVRAPAAPSRQPQPQGNSVVDKAVGGIQAGGRAVAHGLDAAGEWTLDQFRTGPRAVLTGPATHLVASMPATVHASGFVPGDSAVIGIGSTLQTLAMVTVDGRGDVNATVDLPPGTQPGAHVLFAAGFTPNGDYRVQWAPTTVQGPGLLAPLVVTGLGLLLCAMAAVRIRRVPPEAPRRP